MCNPALRSQTIDDVAATRFGATLPEKPVSAETGAEESLMARRAAAEALTALLARPALEQELTDGGLTNLFAEVEMPLVPVLARMEEAGILIDRETLAAMREEFATQLAGLETRIYELVGREFNIGSPKQLEVVLFDELGLPSTKRTRTSRSTDASVLDELRDKHEVVGLILEHRQVAKLKSTYVDALPTLVDGEGRLHTTYQQAVAATGRLSSTDPNLQNIPIRTALGRRIRRAFVAPEGKLLMGADYSQQELRILAHVSGDEGLRADFAARNDIHLAAAARVLGLGPDEVGPKERSVAKMINYGIAYGLSDYGLAERLKIPREEAHRFIEDYYVAYPGIRRYTVEMKMLARDQGFVTTLLGRRRYLPELTARNGALRAAGERMAINMPIQGTAADGMKLAMVRMDAALRERGDAVPDAPPGPRRARVRDRCGRAAGARRAGQGDHGGGAAARRAARGGPQGGGELGGDGPAGTRRGRQLAAGPEDGDRGGARGGRRGGRGRARLMPELPEVETVARDLQHWVAGATIVDASVTWDRTIRHPQPPERFVAEISGATIRRVDRRAKTVLLHLEDGRVMTVALRMTGALIVTARRRTAGPARARRLPARRRPPAPLPRPAEVRTHRPLAGRGPALGGRRTRHTFEEGSRGRNELSHR